MLKHCYEFYIDKKTQSMQYLEYEANCIARARQCFIYEWMKASPVHNSCDNMAACIIMVGVLACMC